MTDLEIAQTYLNEIAFLAESCNNRIGFVSKLPARERAAFMVAALAQRLYTTPISDEVLNKVAVAMNSILKSLSD